MAASVQVLCPNGRRQNVKVTPNTKLLQVLEEVCQRQGFIPPEDFKLIQGRKDLDLSLSFRFSSLPNNAKLELARSTTARVEQDVTIALQLDSGQRLQDKFLPSTSLWDLLLQFEDKNGDHKGQLTRVEMDQGRSLHPVCIIMREEVIGEQALKATTLKKLALTSGKAIIRLLHRPVEEAMIADITDKVEKDKVKQTKLEEIAQKKKEMLDEREREDRLKTSMREERLSQLEEDGESEGRNDMMTGSGEDSQHRQQQQHQQPGSDVVEDMETGSENDNDDTLRSSSSDMSARQRSGRTKATSNPPSNQAQFQPDPIQELRALNIPGVDIYTPDDFSDLTPQEQIIARRLAQRFLPHLQGTSSQLTTVGPGVRQDQTGRLRDEQSSNVFLDFKFPEETRGKDLNTADRSSSSQPDSSPCGRDPLVYDAKEALPGSSQELPDSFFDVTQSDVRLMYKDLQSAVNKMEDQPLMTKTMKQALAEAAYDHYERVIIRVHFPDKLVLQAFFRPRETVGTLHSFVKECLQEKNLKFYLYTTPPKTILKNMRSSLAMNDLAPAALVYFGCSQERDHYIRQDLLASLKSRLEAEECVTLVLNQNDSGATSNRSVHPSDSNNLHTPGTSGMSSSRAAGRTSHASSSSSPSTLPSGAKVPKWLKLGKK